MARSIFWFCISVGAAGMKLPTPESKIFLISQPDDDGTDTPLTLNHLPKAGGTFAKLLIQASLKTQGTRIENEMDSLTPDDLSKTFVVGLMRNPFDYYVSLWSYCSGGGAFPGPFRDALTPTEQEETLAPSRGADEMMGNPDDVMRFRKWMRVVNHEEMGLLTYRFYMSYVSQGSRGVKFALARTARQEVLRDSSVLDVIEHGYEVVDKICWIHTESIVDDTRSCLEKYESQSGRGSKVDWGIFEAAVVNTTHNPTNHASCSTFYDQDTIEYIAKSDRHLFELFPRYVGQCL